MKPEIHQSLIRAFGDCPAKAKMSFDGKKGHVVPLFENGSRLHEYWYAYTDHCQANNLTRDDEWADAMADVCDDKRHAKAIRQCPLTIVLRPEYECKGLEHSFRIELEHCFVAGRLDRLEYDPAAKTWRVIDYKSGFKPLRQEEIPFQLKLYAAAINQVEGAEGDRFECWYVYPEANPDLPPSMWTLEQEDLRGVLESVDEWCVNFQNMTRFEPCPSQQACQACPYLLDGCPEWPDPDEMAMPVVDSTDVAEMVWQVRQWADAAVKAWSKENGAVGGYTFMPPKYSEQGGTHWKPAGNPRTKAGKQVVHELIRKIFGRAARSGDVQLGSALEVKSYWLNKVMAENGEIAEDIREFVEPVAVAAEFRQHLGGDE